MNLTDPAKLKAQHAVLPWLAEHKVDRIETNVIYAVATRA